MKRYLIFLSVFVLAAFSVSAQKDASEDVKELKSGQVEVENELLYPNQAMINQSGFSNTIKTVQEQQGVLQNSLNAIQRDGNQQAYIEQTGTGLQTTLLQANENFEYANGGRVPEENVGNIANIWSVGHNIIQTVTQLGSGNEINSLIENSTLNVREAQLYQEGMNNSINLAVKGPWNGAGAEPDMISVKQEGIGFSVSALMEPYSKPVIVHQYNGWSGGMDVQIHTTTNFTGFPAKK
ncbi:hypothetical protein [Draconibacterium halophilum]|uniref:Curlin associated repeat-containing protein n=1 Tax=Draconibacterium halophilum TaxID=2706887 RepID=A0A6C0RDZ4_9BACT|nr:hypothetical protein [Draconibacterium halophilum]QIA08156.1 hypothetical protein G0Q07_10695 [Draconibacterium halophilum]